MSESVSVSLILKILAVIICFYLFRKYMMLWIILVIGLLVYNFAAKADSYAAPASKTISKAISKDLPTDQIIRTGITKQVGAGLLQMYVRGCGMVPVMSNSLNEAPKHEVKIEYIQKRPCVIEDWRFFYK